MSQEDWPRIKDLPEAEREPFTQWLGGQTRPLEDGYEEIPEAEWDWFYQWDYDRWKAGVVCSD